MLDGIFIGKVLCFFNKACLKTMRSTKGGVTVEFETKWNQ